ncbi:MAG TPA: alpha/beta fold hydrolase [Bacteroidetes bacterium]|nr:alpha/beta fold hydrolase [Bacteroidota bacterium]
MQLNYKEFGQGQPIIILHGLFGMLDNWQTIAKKLAEDYSVYILDQRNHGRSPHADEHDYTCMAEDLRIFMEDHWIYKAHIMGHSMGGKTAMQFALDFPDMVDKLIVVDISPKAYPGGHHQIFEALLSLDLNKIKNRKQADAHLAKTISDPAIRLFLMKNLTRDKKGGYKLKMNLPVIFKHYKDILAPIDSTGTFDGPALFIRGGNSKHMEDGDEVLIKKMFPAAVIKTVKGAGHWVHAEAPAELLSLVKNFLR